MTLGPTPLTRDERLTIAREVADRALALYGGELKAVGLYGSMARGTDGPFSDLEIFCVLRRPGADFSHEWVAGPWKAEVDFYGEDVLLGRAADVEGRWPLTHGAYHQVLPLYDPESFFEDLRAAAESRTDEQFRAAIEGVLTGEMFEYIGKLRNLKAAKNWAYLPELAMLMAKYGAFLIGLHNRRYFSTAGRVLAEALAMPSQPAGFGSLCHLVMTGQLADHLTVAEACEQFWEGVVAWAEEHGYKIASADRIPF